MEFADEVMDVLGKYYSDIPQELLSDLETLLDATYIEGYNDRVFNSRLET